MFRVITGWDTAFVSSFCTFYIGARIRQIGINGEFILKSSKTFHWCKMRSVTWQRKKNGTICHAAICMVIQVVSWPAGNTCLPRNFLPPSKALKQQSICWKRPLIAMQKLPDPLRIETSTGWEFLRSTISEMYQTV